MHCRYECRAKASRIQPNLNQTIETKPPPVRSDRNRLRWDLKLSGAEVRPRVGEGLPLERRPDDLKGGMEARANGRRCGGGNRGYQ